MNHPSRRLALGRAEWHHHLSRPRDDPKRAKQVQAPLPGTRLAGARDAHVVETPAAFPCPFGRDAPARPGGPGQQPAAKQTLEVDHDVKTPLPQAARETEAAADPPDRADGTG